MLADPSQLAKSGAFASRLGTGFLKNSSPLDQLSSAELPAEFRDGPDALEAPAKEQSKLARLCQQTSTVLASVLPAPFGGHKRSILCQFFGQVPITGQPQNKQPLEQQQRDHHFRAQPESIAILQQPLRPPMALIPSGRHPIQLVLEQHKLQASSRPVQAPLKMPAQASVLEQKMQPILDLQGSPSILSHAYHQKVQAPANMLSGFGKPTNLSKFSSTPSAVNSFKPLRIGQSGSSANQLSKSSSGTLGGGWHIFDQPSSASYHAPEGAHQAAAFDAPKVNSTAAQKLAYSKQVSATVNGNNQTISNPDGLPNYWLSGKQLVLGKPPGFDLSKPKNESASSIDPNRHTANPKSTTRLTMSSTTVPPIAYSNATLTNSTSMLNQTSPASSASFNLTTSTTPKPDPKPSEKREELVIASINNLTRIAFGNQLRDTVKVINRLIDQQSSLFNTNKSYRTTDELLAVSESHKIQLTKSSENSGKSRQKQIAASKTTSSDMRKGKSSTHKESTRKQDRNSNASSTSSTRMPRASSTSKRPRSGSKSITTDRPKSRFKYPSSESRRLTPASTKAVSRSLLLDNNSLSVPTLPVADFKRDRSPWRQVSSTTALPEAGSDVKKARMLYKSTTKFSAGDLWTSASAPITSTKKWSQRRDTIESKSTSPAKLEKSPNSIFAKSDEPLSVRKLDSLTALKMSILPATAQTSPPTTSTTAGYSKGQQSRWVPTSAMVTNRSLSTQPSLSSSTTTASPEQRSSQEAITLPSQSTSLNDLNEVRASDSISKYTTHLNEANELLATTRRFFTQPLPQIAKTGEFFSAETISSWPERYQTMVDQQRQTTPSLAQIETTRRNGETYETSVYARHRFDTTPAVGSVSMSQLPAGVTVLPANHKLTTLPVELLGSSGNLVADLAKKSTTYSLVGTMSGNELSSLPISTTVSRILPTQTTSLPMDTFPRIYPGNEESALDANSTSNSVNSPSNSYLRPPYLDGASNVSSSESQIINKPHVSRKLYELLMPSTKNFVGAQNPLNQQRINLSALRFLAQNLLTNSSDLSGSLPIDELGRDTAEEEKNVTRASKLLDLFGSPSSLNYFSLFQNDSTADEKYPKSLVSKTSELLSDLRSMERKRAAAILAAIRYQVPSPLVRPWDLTSDASRVSDQLVNQRSDTDTEPNLSLWTSLLFGQTGKAIQAAIQGQRLVQRDELEVKLNRRAPVSADRREESADTREVQLDLYPRYSFTGDEVQNNRSKSFNGTTSSVDQTGLDNSIVAGNRTRENEKSNREADVYPKYMRLTDYHTASSVKPDNLRTKSMLSILHSSSVGARLKNNLARLRSSMANGSEILEEQVQVETQKTLESSANESFDCAGKPAGFYPNTESACQTFYHCSSSGHLLSFDCPQQTRFDQRSLKCGPWFEVPCAVSKKLINST